MGRSATAIQAEITTIEAQLQAAVESSTGVDGASISFNREALERRLDKLYIQQSRANGSAPMMVRGVVRGL